MPFDLDKYGREADNLVQAIKASLDPMSELRYSEVGSPVLATRITGLCRRPGGFVLKVKEYFNLDPDRGLVVKDYRYTILQNGEELLRLETEGGKPEHAHFPKRFLSGNGRHFNIDRWPADLQDIDFIKIFRLFGEIVRNGGRLPEPFSSAR